MRFARGMSAAIMAVSMAAAAAAQQAPAAGGQRAGGAPAAPAQPAMRVTSRSFGDGAVIPPINTAAGMSRSPQLTWTNAPAATQSFVVHMHDMEGARNKTSEDQLHWLV